MGNYKHIGRLGAAIFVAIVMVISGMGPLVGSVKADGPTALEPSTSPLEEEGVTGEQGEIRAIESLDPDAVALLIQDVNPWYGRNVHHALHEFAIPHDLINSSSLATWDLSQYKFILYASSQTDNYYVNIAANLDKISTWVSNGGLLIAHCMDGGWYVIWPYQIPGGSWQGLSILPGGVTHLMHRDDMKYAADMIHITEPNHGVVKSDEYTLTDSYLAIWYASTCGIFTNLPPNAEVVMVSNEGDGGDGPTYIDYNYGSGKVLATLNTVEWGYYNGLQYFWGRNRPELLRNELRYALNYTPQAPEAWSFAVITDLHIGWGIPDYGNEGYSDATAGQEYYLTERLRNAVQWINNNDTENNIKFVVVDGDIADTGELSEFVRARDILNELEIPYIPIMGNHDVWPYTQRINGDPDTRRFNTKYGIINGPPLGEQYFEQIFWQDNSANISKLTNLLGKLPEMQDIQYLQNYAFSHGGTNFIALDFATRNRSGFNEIQVGGALGVLHQETIDWFGEELENNDGETIHVFAHHPFLTTLERMGCFWPLDRLTISNYIRNCNCNVVDFGGHTHINETSSPGGEYAVIETEAVLQPRMINYVSTGEFVRLVRIEDQDINYDTLISISPPSINPFFKVSHEILAVGQEITFMAYTGGQENRIAYFSWDFGDGEHVTTSNPIYRKTYNTAADREVTLTATDVNGNSESLSWSLTIKQTAQELHGVLLPITGLVPLLGDMDLTQFPQNTASWAVITKVTSPGKPIASLLIHFEEATENVDLSGIIADTDMAKRKSVVHMDSWPEIIDDSKALFIPSTGVGSVYVCPNAISLEEVTPLGKDVTVLDIGETEKGMTLITDDYYGPDYYLVLGIQNTGGGEYGTLEKSIKSLNDYIHGLPDGAFKNNPEQRKNALENKLNEVWSKIDNQEYQEAINKLQNDVRAKADGDKKAEDWITDPEAQQEICRMVDELISYISGL